MLSNTRRSTSLGLFFLVLVASALIYSIYSTSTDGLCGTAEGVTAPLPNPQTFADGTPVRSASEWWMRRRPELRAAYETHVYGALPPAPPMQRTVIHEASTVRAGAAIRKQITVHFTDDANGPQMDVLLYLPADRSEPVPAFVALNFAGNHTVAPDTALRLPRGWVRDRPDVASRSNRAIAAGRGALSHRWPIDSLLARGYALITAHYGDVFPDHPGGFASSVYQLDPRPKDRPENGGAISAWAWGLHRLMDVAARTPAIDSSRVILVGHSRLGKAALWAAATDKRFAAVVGNASGLAGAALFRRRCGKTLEYVHRKNPHWFTATVGRYHGQDSKLPIDQHLLLALSAPRPLLVNAMTDDDGADPVGMFLAAKHAAPVWAFLGTEGLATDTLPPPDHPVLSRVGFRLRTGDHGIEPSDWSAFLAFADRHVVARNGITARR